MESIELEKQVESLLATPQFEQPAFDQSMSGTIKNIFSKEMLVSSAGTAISVQLGNIVGKYIPIAVAPTGTMAILAGVLLQKFGGSNSMLKNLSLGVIQGGIAQAMTPFTSGLIPQSFSQEVKAEKTEELNPMVKGVMW
tara:strand:+ start:159 stop:575 length:417 start_codon:yes stop_codon:yes gene_type:complete